MYPVILLTIIAGVVFSGGAASAEGVPFKPGKWEMKTIVEMPMMPEPQVMTSTECMEKTELTPGDMVNQNPGQGCTLSDIAVEGNTVRWKMECRNAAGLMRGEGEVTSNGTSVQGRSSVTTSIEGRSMTFRTRWEGRRVGPCD